MFKPKKKFLVIAIAFISILLVAILFFYFSSAANTPNPQKALTALPQEPSFIVSYHQLGNFYKVVLNSQDSQETRNAANAYFSNLGLDPQTTKVIYLTQNDQRLIQNLIKQLPKEAQNYYLAYGSKTDTFFIALFQKPFETSKRQALLFLRSQGIDDLNKIFIIWSEAARPMSPE